MFSMQEKKERDRGYVRCHGECDIFSRASREIYVTNAYKKRDILSMTCNVNILR